MNETPDIVAVGLQELSTNVLHSLISDDSDGYVQNSWVRNLTRSFKGGDEYSMVCQAPLMSPPVSFEQSVSFDAKCRDIWCLLLLVLVALALIPLARSVRSAADGRA